MPQSCQTIRTLLQLLATIYKESHMFEASVPSVSQETLYLATYRQNQPTNDRGSTTTNKPPVDAKGIPAAEVNTSCSLKVKPRNHIHLATAIVEIQNKSGQYVPCRAEVCTAFEVIKDPGTCFYTGHKQCKHCYTPQCYDTFQV